jgi:hypothetical protein
MTSTLSKKETTVKSFYRLLVDKQNERARQLKDNPVVTGFNATLQEAEKLLKLPDDWDNKGTRGYKQETLDRVAELLVSIVDRALMRNNKVEAPVVEPGMNGALVIKWKYAGVVVTEKLDEDLVFKVFADDGAIESEEKFPFSTVVEVMTEWFSDS